MPEQTQGPDLISLTFSSCFGGGAAGRVTAPGGDPDTGKGPISAVSLTSSGSGYAKLGRVAPTLTISGGSGTGATFTPTLASTDDACGVPTWSLSSVAFKGGTGYVDGDELSVSEAVGDTAEAVAVVRVQTTRTQPTLSASASGGSGATFTVTTASNGDTPQTWGVSGVSVSGTTSSYADMTKLSFSGTGVVEQIEAEAYVRTVRVQPTPTLTVQSLGSGAGLTATLTQIDDPAELPARPAWEVSAITITAGGTGYSVYDAIDCTTDGQGSPYSWFYAYVEEVDEDGAILAVTLSSGGAFFKSTGEIDEVQVNSGGEYYHDDGIPTGVTVENGGQYYREDASEPPYVAEISILTSQGLPSAGAGAILTATVNDDTSSPTFGQVTGLAITDAGTGYLAWKWINSKCCGSYYNGMSVVVRRNNSGIGVYNPSEPCVYMHRFCGVGNINTNPGHLSVEYYGPNAAPQIRLVSEDRRDRAGTVSSDTVASEICSTTFTTSQTVPNCDTWLDADGDPLEFTAASGATATLVVGGEYDQGFRDSGGLSCNICCKGEDPIPLEVEATINDPRENKIVDLSGTYVLKLFPRPPLGVRWVTTAGGITRICPSPANPGECVSIEIQLEPCSSQANGFTEDAYGCDFCHQKCRAFAAVSLEWYGYGYHFYYTSTAGQDMCAMCQETPTCSVAGMTWTATSTQDGSMTVTT
jgi:hypothetical protein